MPVAIFVSPFTAQASGGTPAATLTLYPNQGADLTAIDTSAGAAAGTYSSARERYSAAIDVALGVYRGVVTDDATGGILSEYVYHHNGDAVVMGTDSAALAEHIETALIEHFETETRAKGSHSYLDTLELIAAATVGKSSAPSGTTEKFLYLDDTDAFTTTFDGSGFRSDVTVH